MEASHQAAIYGHAWQASAGSVIGTGGAGGHELIVPVGPPDPPGLAGVTVDGTQGFRFTARGVHVLAPSVKVHMPTSGECRYGKATVGVYLLGGEGDGALVGYLPGSVDILTDASLSFTITAAGPVRPVDGLGLDQAYKVKASWLWVTEESPGDDPYADAPTWITYRIDNPGAGT